MYFLNMIHPFPFSSQEHGVVSCCLLINTKSTTASLSMVLSCDIPGCIKTNTSSQIHTASFMQSLQTDDSQTFCRTWIRVYLKQSFFAYLTCRHEFLQTTIEIDCQKITQNLSLQDKRYFPISRKSLLVLHNTIFYIYLLPFLYAL